MGFIGVVSTKKELIEIKKHIQNNYKVIELKKTSIKNIRNVKFDMIIFNRDIDLEICEYEYMKDILKQVDYIIVNSDINFTIFEKIELNYPIKIITYGFNPKASILISSVKEDYILISIQRKIQKNNREILENQERKIETKYNEKNKIYEKIIVFILKELHNL